MEEQRKITLQRHHAGEIEVKFGVFLCIKLHHRSRNPPLRQPVGRIARDFIIAELILMRIAQL